MRLKKKQKIQLLKWIAEGLQSDEINERASVFDEPFNVSRQHVDFYRKTRKIDIEQLQNDAEHEALNTGLALKSERVKKLRELAARLEKDLFGDEDLIWTNEIKGVGSGPIAEIVEYDEFNKAEIDAYRGVLDDIAKELSQRVQRQEVTGKDGGAQVIKVELLDE